MLCTACQQHHPSLQFTTVNDLHLTRHQPISRSTKPVQVLQQHHDGVDGKEHSIWTVKFSNGARTELCSGEGMATLSAMRHDETYLDWNNTLAEFEYQPFFLDKDLQHTREAFEAFLINYYWFIKFRIAPRVEGFEFP